MAKNKLYRYAELPTLNNVVNHPHIYKGRWGKSFFKNDKPILAELGCGRGEYTLALAETDPDKNYIAIDIKGARLWVAAKKAIDSGFDNTAFVRIYIEKISEIFDTHELAEIWLPFPDPFPKKPGRRLLSPRFLEVYRELLKPGSKVHFKTDDTDYYEYGMEVLENEGYNIERHNADIYQEEEPDPRVYVQTTFERKHLALGKTIKYICISF